MVTLRWLKTCARTRSDVELDHVISRHGLLRIDGRVGSGRLILEQTDGLLDGRQRVDHETGQGGKRTAPFSINWHYSTTTNNRRASTANVDSSSWLWAFVLLCHKHRGEIKIKPNQTWRTPRRNRVPPGTILGIRKGINCGWCSKCCPGSPFPTASQTRLGL